MMQDIMIIVEEDHKDESRQQTHTEAMIKYPMDKNYWLLIIICMHWFKFLLRIIAL